MAQMQDPAFAAFVAAAGLQDEIGMAEAARKRTAINQALGLSNEDTQESGEVERRNISGNQESRGVFRSGQTRQLTDEQERRQARQLAYGQLTAGEAKADIEHGLAANAANRNFDYISKALDVAGNQTLDAYNNSVPTDDEAGITPLRSGLYPRSASPTATVYKARKKLF